MPSTMRSPGSSLSEINMVPFIDVMLVLLVIFMITAPVLQSGIQVNLPKTRTVKQIKQARVVITIDRAQRVYLNDKPINIHQLGADVKAVLTDPAHQPVYIRCDETVPFGSFATVTDQLEHSGIQNISVVTVPITERPRGH
ncbi:MAG TPA: biopolymer transporter ExbD [Candidatus Dormibacteraeota bacterium]|nr:biopolymer transporter ExbD [Candidatus Dormibacteraeota bacterium]